MNDLSTMLREAVSDAPQDAFEPQDLLAAGRRRLRRRRTIAAGVAAVVVAAVAAAGATVPHLHRSAPEPVGPTQPRIVRLADLPDSDAPTVVRHEPVPRGVHLYLGLLPNGGPIEVAGDAAHAQRFTVDGTTVRGLTRGTYLGLSNGRPVFDVDRNVGTGIVEGPASDLHVYDPASHRLGPRIVPTPVATTLLETIVHGRLYTNDMAANEYAAPGAYLSSVPLDGSRTPSWQRGERAELVASDGDSTLVYTDKQGQPDRVTVRDVTTGAARTFDPKVGRGCRADSLAASARYVALALTCDPITEVRVFTTAGTPVLTAQGDDAGVGGSGSGAILISSGGEHAGVFVLTDEGKLLRLPGSSVDSQASAVTTGSGTLVSWIRSSSAGKEYVVARLH